MPTIKQPKKVSWKAIALIVLLLLSAFAIVSLINRTDDGEANLTRSEGSTILEYSGRTIEPPKGYEFTSQKALEAEQADEYSFARKDTSNNDIPTAIFLREYSYRLEDDRIGTEFTEEGETPLSQYAQFLSEESDVARPHKDYTARVDVTDTGFKIVRTYNEELPQSLTLYTTEVVILGEESRIRTQIRATSSESQPDEGFIDLFSTEF